MTEGIAGMRTWLGELIPHLSGDIASSPPARHLDLTLSKARTAEGYRDNPYWGYPHLVDVGRHKEARGTSGRSHKEET